MVVDHPMTMGTATEVLDQLLYAVAVVIRIFAPCFGEGSTVRYATGKATEPDPLWWSMGASPRNVSILKGRDKASRSPEDELRLPRRSQEEEKLQRP